MEKVIPILIILAISVFSEVSRKRRNYRNRRPQPRRDEYPVTPGGQGRNGTGENSYDKVPLGRIEVQSQLEREIPDAPPVEKATPVAPAGYAARPGVPAKGRAGLTLRQRRLQAGLIWSELWQPPLAYRKRRR